MSRFIFSFGFAVCSVVSSLCAGPAVSTPPPRIAAGRTAQPPRIDGLLKDACWEDA